MLLHDHCTGCKSFVTSRGRHFIPRGEAPRDEMTPKGCCKTFASQTMIVQQYFYIVYKINLMIVSPALQSFLSHGTLQSFLAKLFIPWEKSFAPFFRQIEVGPLYLCFKINEIFCQIDKKLQIPIFSINLMKKPNCANLFPMECCKAQ